ncbi:M23 family metallopeptidase [Leucobacter sp. BZR 635]
MSVPPQEPSGYPSRRSLREAQQRADALQQASAEQDEQAPVQHAEAQQVPERRAQARQARRTQAQAQRAETQQAQKAAQQARKAQQAQQAPPRRADATQEPAEQAPAELTSAQQAQAPAQQAPAPAQQAQAPAQQAPAPSAAASTQQPQPLTAEGLLLTPLPEFTLHTAAPTDITAAPASPARPRSTRRTVKRIAAATFSLACVGTLAVTTTLPAFSSAFGDTDGVAARAAQHLQSSAVTQTQDALGAIGSVELGVDPGSYKQITPEAGLVDPATLENTEIRYSFDREFPLTDGFAYRTAPVEQFHDAQDIAAPGGTPVLAIGSGVVIEAGYANDGCGFSIKLQHKVSEETLTSRYCHMQVDSHDRKVGDKVEIGDFVGRVGNTGMSFGDHLHLALRRSGVPIDPLPYIDEQIEKAAKRAAASK